MTRIFAYPLLWLGLFAMWLLLSRSLAPGQLLLGALVASFCCWAIATFGLRRPDIRKPGLVLKLFGLVLADIFRSNLAVLQLAVTRREPKSVFVTIPLELREPNALAVLACIITATPGSAWIDYNARSHTVLVHVLDTEDDIAWVETIKRNYEALLLEIFQ